MKRFLTLTVYIFSFQFVYGQESYEFDGTTISPGSKRHFSIPVSDDSGNETTIPITIFHGKGAGPVLGITAGVHGYEYAPILAAQDLIQRVDPGKLSGTIILVQIANVSSFLGRSPFLNPKDGKNLNRSFPGRANGSITERMADYISENVIARADYFIDMHSGDAPEDLMPYVGYYQHDDKREISFIGREMAVNMGFDHVLLFKTTGKEYMDIGSPSLYCSAEAFKRGIPAADIECGRLGMIEPESVQKIVTGMESLLGHLRMIDQSPIPSGETIFIEERSYISSPHTGIFYPVKSSGDYVLEGMKLGYITDFFGKKLINVHAVKSGIILYILGTPPVSKGETLVSIGIVN